MSAESVARAHQRGRQQLADAVSHLARDLWRQMDPANLDASWARIAPQLLVGLTGAQLAAARTADGYVADMLAEQGADAAAAFTTNPGALVGFASDGRDLPGLLLNAVTTVKASIGTGATVKQAMAGGLANLTMLVQTQVADAGRSADGVSMVAHPAAQGYVRMVSGGACGRCVVLAGKFYRWNKGFKRHPHCHCTNVPAAEDHVGDIRTHPRAFFDSLPAAEQDKQFTKAGAQAIRDGADISQVVNARRGAYGLTPAGARITADEARALRNGLEVGRLQTRNVFGHDLFVTTEGTTTRGVAGRRLGARESGVKRAGGRYRSARPPRLMPESIYQIAGDDRAEALRLLERNGYIRPGSPARRLAIPRVPTLDERFARAASGQDALDAPTFGLDRRGAARPTAFTQAMADSLSGYQGSDFANINRRLRGQPLKSGLLNAALTDAAVADIDAAMAASTLARETLMYRGVEDAGTMFGARLDGDLTGLEWREDAYVSTSADRAMAEGFAATLGDSGLVMRILTPKGTGAVQVSGLKLEAEILLHRGMRFRVIRDRGRSPVDGLRHIDVEVLRD